MCALTGAMAGSVENASRTISEVEIVLQGLPRPVDCIALPGLERPKRSDITHADRPSRAAAACGRSGTSTDAHGFRKLGARTRAHTLARPPPAAPRPCRVSTSSTLEMDNGVHRCLHTWAECRAPAYGRATTPGSAVLRPGGRPTFMANQLSEKNRGEWRAGFVGERASADATRGCKRGAARLDFMRFSSLSAGRRAIANRWRG